MAWVWICTEDWTGAFDIDDKGIITSTPPIARWGMGKPFTAVVKRLYVQKKLVDFKIYGWQELLEKHALLTVGG